MTTVVITGMGVVSPLGCGVDRVWARLLEGRSGISRLPDAVVEDVACKVGGVVPTLAEDAAGGFDLDAHVSPREQKRMDRFIHFALGAADEALAAAVWKPTDTADLERTGVIIASGVGGFPAMVEATRITDAKGPRRLSPFTVPAFLVNLAAGQISIRYGFKGPLGAPVTACAASVQALGDAARMIRAGEADVVVAGGAEACIDRVSLGAFAAARALSSDFNDTPQQASRPYDRDRDGFVMGEGAAVLVLESEAHARARGATILAEVAGYGTSADAYQMTAGPPDGEGAIRAMRIALTQAGISAAEVDHINAHATSTPVGDAGELAAIRALFGEGGPPISATKGATGHLLGAAGALEAVFTVMALREGVLPPTLNLDHPDAAAQGLDIVAGEPRRRAIHYALSNGFGFGGVNASIVLKRHGD